MKILDSTIVVGILSVIGTLVGSFGGIIASNKLTNYRIEQLEKKVDKHNTIIERTYIVEKDMKTAFSYIEELKKNVKNLQDDILEVKEEEIKLSKEVSD